MNISQTSVLNFSYAAAAATAFLFWQVDMYIPAMVCLLLGGGVAVARPHIEDAHLVLDGTPVLLLFAVLLVSASSMVVAVDQISAFFSAPADTSCVTSEQAALFRVGIE